MLPGVSLYCPGPDLLLVMSAFTAVPDDGGSVVHVGGAPELARGEQG